LKLLSGTNIGHQTKLAWGWGVDWRMDGKSTWHPANKYSIEIHPVAGLEHVLRMQL
jgi:hypothetical protein